MLRPALALLLGLLVVAPAMSETARQQPGDAAAEPEPQPPVVDEWQVYFNEKYGYEIRYPPSHEVWPTGPPGERDGRSIRIARREHAAPAPVLDISVFPEPPDPEALAREEAVDLDIAFEDADVGGVRAQAVYYRWKSNGELLFVELYLRNVQLRFHSAPGLRDARETVWWKIMTTFRILDG